MTVKTNRRLAALLIFAALGLAACNRGPVPTPARTNPEAIACQTGINTILNAWQPRGLITTQVVCAEVRPGFPFGGAYFGWAGNDKVVLYFGNANGQGAAGYAETLSHELGHSWDFHHLIDAQRTRFGQIVGRPWHSEDYADTFAAILWPGYHLAYGFGYPTPAQRAALCTEGIVPSC